MGRPLVEDRPRRRVAWCVVAVALVPIAACAAGASEPTVRPAPTSAQAAATASTVAPVRSDPPPAEATTTPVATTATPTSVLPPTTAAASPMPIVDAAVDPDVLAGISMTDVPPDVIVPTSPASLDEVTNPINGRRSSRRPTPEELDCPPATPMACLTAIYDSLGLDVTSGSSEEQVRRQQRATAVLQLDAGLPVTGQPDDALLRYLRPASDDPAETRADEARRIGTSAQGRPIMAMRYGDGPRTVLVVGQTHGDEEGGLRVLLRARTLPLADDVTLWVIPTMNPDGQILDTRFLANRANPNRRAPSEPEQRAVHDFALATRPSLTIWYHQNYAWVGGSGASMAPASLYQALTGLGTLHRSGDCSVGFTWCPIDAALGSSSILVELPDVLTPADVHIHALALVTVASTDT